MQELIREVFRSHNVTQQTTDLNRTTRADVIELMKVKELRRIADLMEFVVNEAKEG